MRSLPAAFAMLITLVLPAVATATSDGGASLQLLAVAGKGERYAIMATSSVQGGCDGGGCQAFAVDVAARSPRRHFLRTLPSAANRPAGETQLDRYLAALDDRALAQLMPVQVGITPTRLQLDRDGSSERALRFKASATAQMSVSLHRSAPFMAAAVYDRRQRNGDELRACIDGAKQQPLCSSCKRISLRVDGEVHRVWSCPGLGRYRGATGKARTCDCRARGRISRLHVRAGHAAAGWRGSAVVAVPRAMGQNWMGGSADIVLRLNPQHSDMQVAVLRSGLLAFGSVAHAPMANGTYFPVFAAAPPLPPARPTAAPR